MTDNPPTRLQRIVGTTIVFAVIVPWRTLLLPLALLGAAADWWAFTVDRFLQKKIGPEDRAVYRFAWWLGNRAVGVKRK